MLPSAVSLRTQRATFTALAQASTKASFDTQQLTKQLEQVQSKSYVLVFLTSA
ncbi:hypothetical protein JCM18905_4992 [Vibrio sp. JCM 18905]|nr:hypothetical protein JCM18905_4992 [Vibrio sp. JCM 18905]